MKMLNLLNRLAGSRAAGRNLQVGGVCFICLGVLGLGFAVQGLWTPVHAEPGTVISSTQESPSSARYATQIRLDDGRQIVMVDPSPRDKGFRLKVIGKDGIYELYDPSGPWIGSLVALAAGSLMYVSGRAIRKP